MSGVMIAAFATPARSSKSRSRAFGSPQSPRFAQVTAATAQIVANQGQMPTGQLSNSLIRRNHRPERSFARGLRPQRQEADRSLSEVLQAIGDTLGQSPGSVSGSSVACLLRLGRGIPLKLTWEGDHAPAYTQRRAGHEYYASTSPNWVLKQALLPEGKRQRPTRSIDFN